MGAGNLLESKDLGVEGMQQGTKIRVLIFLSTGMGTTCSEVTQRQESSTGTTSPLRLMATQNKNFGEEHMDNQEDLMPDIFTTRCTELLWMLPAIISSLE